MIPLTSLPTAFSELLAGPPPGYSVSERVIEPVVLLSRTGRIITASLGGRRRLPGGDVFLEAPSNSHAWVADGTILRPLPVDATDLFSECLCGENPRGIRYATAIRLMRTPPEGFITEAPSELLHPGKLAAGELPTVLQVPGLAGATLKPYQAQGISWMHETIATTGGLILADEMGLGKTLQVIALLLMDPPERNFPALVACPTSLIANWVRELGKFAPGLSVKVHRGPDRAGTFRGLQTAQVMVTSYETVVNDISIFSSFEWSWVICDEAQAIKNPGSDRRRSLATIPRRNTIPMTGTPVENTLVDLWSLADFAVPGMLGTKEDFERDFPDTVESGEALRQLTDPIILRRLVRDVAADLPDRIDIDLPLELDGNLARHYEEVRQKVLREYPVAGALVATLQLQLLCAHPWLRFPEDPIPTGPEEEEHKAPWENADLDCRDFPLITPKLERAKEILRESFFPPGLKSVSSSTGPSPDARKVLVFSLFNRVGDLLRKACEDFGPVHWGAINGSTFQEDRQRIVDEFSAHAGPACLVLNPKAAGAGLNITAATVVVHFTPVWNPALELQASARVYRLGQQEKVTLYRLFYQDTVEEVMIDRSAWKRSLADQTVPESSRDSSDLKRALEITPEKT